MNKVTMQDIADELGISRVTVWKVFNNYSNVSPALRERVLSKAKELGYTKGIAELVTGSMITLSESGKKYFSDRVQTEFIRILDKYYSQNGPGAVFSQH